VGGYAGFLWRRERCWWPLAIGVPAMVALWIVPDWIGSGVFVRVSDGIRTRDRRDHNRESGMRWDEPPV
jgi:hypothetical protein